MSEYTIYYRAVEDGKEFEGVGSGTGKTEAEAIADFLFWHGNECKAIQSVELYR